MKRRTMTQRLIPQDLHAHACGKIFRSYLYQSYLSCICKMKYPYAGIILAGGMNRRMEGRNKALLSVGDQSIVDRQIELFEDLFEQVILVTNQPLEFVAWECLIVSDLLSVRSSMSGIHAGLFYTRSSHAFITACDMPFLKKEMIQLLMQNLEPKWDVIVPVTKEGYQPLCAVYSKRCLKTH